MSALADSTNTIVQEKEAVEKTSVAETVVESAAVVENSAPEADSTTTIEDKVSDAKADKEAVEKTNGDEKTEETVGENSAPESKVSDDAEAEKEAVEETNVGEKAEETVGENSAPESKVSDEADIEMKAAEDVVESTTTETEKTADLEAPAESMEEVEISREEKLKKYEEHIIAGRRFLKTNTFNQATECFSQAAEIASEVHGDCSELTFEANYLYGKALLELGKVEDDVLTNALTDAPKGENEVQDDVVENPEEVPEEKQAEIKEKVEEASDSKVTTSAMESIEEKNEESAEETKEEGEKEQTAEDVEATEEEGSNDGSDADEPVRLAWELLESCRRICEKKLKSLEEENADVEAVKTWKLNHADVLTSLGEHGMVDSKYEQAQKDLAEAITIQTAHLPATSRILANTTHLLAKAFSLDSAFEMAVTHFSNSKNILIAKTEELKKALESAGENEKSGIEAEIKELEELIPELDVFVNDARASAEQTQQIKETARKELTLVAEHIAKLGEEEANDITDMVRRPTKRPASEDRVEETKKRKSEEAATTVPDETAVETSEESESAPAPVSPTTSQ